VAESWYFSRGAERFGPYSQHQIEELVWREKLLPTDLLWHEGMEAGRPAGSFGGLFPTPTPPAPNELMAAPKVLPPAVSGKLHPQRLLLGGLSLLGALLTFVPWWGFFMVGMVSGTYGSYGWVTLGLFTASLVMISLGKRPAAPTRLQLLACAALGSGAALFVGWAVSYISGVFGQNAAILDGNWFGDILPVSQKLELGAYLAMLIGSLIGGGSVYFVTRFPKARS